MPKFRIIGDNAITGDDGKEVEPGGEVVIDDETRIAQLVYGGHIEAETATAKKAAKAAEETQA